MPSFPSHTRAVICPDLNGPPALKIQQVALPAVGEHEVGVRMLAGGLNFPDLLMTRGEYQFKPPPPFTPGMEGVGEVICHGAGVSGTDIGDRVVVGARFGLMADHVVVNAAAVAPAPTGFSDEEAASYRTALLTARHALVDRGALARGERVLVLGASGGVGYACVQVARHLGAEVMAGASNASKLEAARNAGATLAVNYGEDDLVDAVRAHWPDGPDIIVDPVGGELFEQALRLPRWGGRLLVVGFASGAIGKAAANLPLIKGYSIIGVRAGEACRRDPALAQRIQTDMNAWTDAGLMRPLVSQTLPIENIREAMEMMDRREAIGRIVLRN